MVALLRLVAGRDGWYGKDDFEATLIARGCCGIPHRVDLCILYDIKVLKEHRDETYCKCNHGQYE